MQVYHVVLHGAAAATLFFLYSAGGGGVSFVDLCIMYMYL